MTDNEIIQKLSEIPCCGVSTWKEVVFGIEWTCNVIPLDLGNVEVGEVKSGCLIIRYEYNGIVFATLNLGKEFFSNLADGQNKFDYIYEQSTLNKPVIIYKDQNEKSTADLWRDGKNSSCLINDFFMR